MFTLASFFLIWLQLTIISETVSLPNDYIQFGGNEEESRQAEYYLSADSGTNIGPTDELKRTQRHFWRNLFKNSLFGDCNKCCNSNNNNYNGGNYDMGNGNCISNTQQPTLPPLSWSSLPLWRPLKPLFGAGANSYNYPPTPSYPTPQSYGPNSYNNLTPYTNTPPAPQPYVNDPPALPAYDNTPPAPPPYDDSPQVPPSYDSTPPATSSYDNSNNHQHTPPPYYNTPPIPSSYCNTPPSSPSYCDNPTTPPSYCNSPPTPPSYDNTPPPTPSCYDNSVKPQPPASSNTPDKLVTVKQTDTETVESENHRDQSPGFANEKIPQIVYQPIIYVSPQYQGKAQNQLKQDDNKELESFFNKHDKPVEELAFDDPSKEENIEKNDDVSENLNTTARNATSPLIPPIFTTPCNLEPSVETAAPPYLVPYHQPQHPNSAVSTVYNIISPPLLHSLMPHTPIPYTDAPYFNTGPLKYSWYSSGSIPLHIIHTSAPQSVPALPAPPVRLSLDDQPYRACPELFAEYERKRNRFWPHYYN